MSGYTDDQLEPRTPQLSEGERLMESVESVLTILWGDEELPDVAVSRNRLTRAGPERNGAVRSWSSERSGGSRFTRSPIRWVRVTVIEVSASDVICPLGSSDQPSDLRDGHSIPQP